MLHFDVTRLEAACLCVRSCRALSLSEYNTPYQSAENRQAVLCSTPINDGFLYTRKSSVWAWERENKTKKKEKAFKPVTGRLEVTAVLQPVNLFLNPADRHLKAYFSQPTNTHTLSTLWPINLKICWPLNLINKLCLFFPLSHPSFCILPHLSCPSTPSRLLPVRGEPQAAVWESGEAALKFLQQRLWQNQACRLPQTNRLK